MKRLFLTAAAAALLSAAGASAHEARPLASGWSFVRPDVPRAERPGFDDRGRAKVAVPHTYNVEDSGLGGSQGRHEPVGAYYRGPAWYRLGFSHTPRPRPRYYLAFDGA